MIEFKFSSAPPAPVREDIVQAHTECWQALAEPGTWWTGAERVAIAAEVRNARECSLCKERKTALSPEAVQGEHDCDSDSILPDYVIDMVHRGTTDPGRTTKKWFEETQAKGLEDTHHVEAVGIICRTLSMDTYCTAIGADLHPLPTPIAGEPERRRPAQAVLEDAWVPLIPLTDEIESPDQDLFHGDALVANVVRSLSLVPNEMKLCIDSLATAQYMDPFKVHWMVLPDYFPKYTPPRAISRGYMEFFGARIAALNECYY